MNSLIAEKMNGPSKKPASCVARPCHKKSFAAVSEAEMRNANNAPHTIRIVFIIVTVSFT